MMRRFRGEVGWIWRSREPARSPPDPRYPRGTELDVTKGASVRCSLRLPYPAQGVGTWLIRCEACGWQGAVTAAGRDDDPMIVLIPCKSDA
jgi:hypothetical protein